ncbi:hypothetical protein GGX14DRAFT_343184, partial [Mycena pura]
CQLSNILKTSIQFVITHVQVAALKTSIIAWVRKYEEYYYQYKEERLSACPLTNILHMAYLEQLGVRYDLEAELWDPNKLSGKSEYTFEGYPQAYLRLPYKRDFIPDDNIRMQVASYFALLVGKTRKEILPLLPQMMPSYGKLRIKDGDSIRSASASGDGSTAERNMSFIRYEIQTRRRVSEPWVSQIFYGRLERILVCDLPASADRKLGSISNKRRLLVVITPCLNTAGKDAALEITTYRGMGSPVVTD